jgi:hypothetical protein
MSTSRYEQCVVNSEGRCTRWSHDHAPNPYYDDDPEVAAAFADIEAHRREAEEIVRALAALDPVQAVARGHSYDFVCSLCEAEHPLAADAVAHESTCPWRRAREWVDG